MNTIKIKYGNKIPDDYTGIVEFEDGENQWRRKGCLHREDGPAIIASDGTRRWYLDNEYVWSSKWNKINYRNCILLSKEQHPEYPTVQIWKYVNKHGIKEQIVIPGMEECIIE